MSIPPWLRRVLEPLVDMLSTALLILTICGLAALLSLLGCRHSETVRFVPVETGSPTCVVVLGPPPLPPMEYRDLPRCAFPGVAPDDPCLTAEQSNTLARYVAQVNLWSVGAYRACAVSDPGITDDVRILAP